MKFKIEIECESFQEFESHLSVIKEQVELTHNRVNLDESDFAPITLKDSNCYGDHKVKIMQTP